MGALDTSSSASRQHFIDTGEYLPANPCNECADGSADDGDYGMCASCLHDALRSGWQPGKEG